MPDVFNECREKTWVRLNDGSLVEIREFIRRFYKLQANYQELQSDYQELQADYYELQKAYNHLKDGKVKKSETVIKKLEVGKWFLIDRDIIEKKWSYIKEEVLRCKGDMYCKRFEESRRIAEENPQFYTRKILTYIFAIDGNTSIDYLKKKCKIATSSEFCDGQTDEVIADLELMMRICNGETVEDIITIPDTLPRCRIISMRDGGVGEVGGSATCHDKCPPAYMCRLIDTDGRGMSADYKRPDITTSVFRREFHED